MNIAVIFAGGQGGRMYHYSRPKQFLEYRGKPVVVYTIEVFQNHPEIDHIIVVCLEGWIPYLKQQVEKFNLTKVADVISGGETGQDSIYLGLEHASKLYPEDSVVLLHDGVRPLVMESTITDNIRMVCEKGSCITCVPAMETMIVVENEDVQIPDRSKALLARAPQSFVLKDVLAIHRQAQQEGIHDFVDTCTMMNHYGRQMHIVEGSMVNIKITTPADYFMFRAIDQAREEGVAFGL